MEGKEDRAEASLILVGAIAALVMAGLVLFPLLLLYFVGFTKTGKHLTGRLATTPTELVRAWTGWTGPSACELWSEEPTDSQEALVVQLINDEGMAARVDPGCDEGIAQEVIREMNRACFEENLRFEHFGRRMRASVQRLCP